jgi:serine/threonine protein kinase
MSTSSEISAPSAESHLLRQDREVFGRYLLEKQVGKGGMGVVWKARDLRLDRAVALKFLADLRLNDAVTRDDLKRETRRSLDLTHPNIVRIHDFVEDDEAAAIVMEYVDGASLSEMRVRLPSRHYETEALEAWTAALCSALAYAHDTGLCVHRDLKPGNLMVNARGALKVTDFGISCSLQNTAARVSAWASTGGTLGYMSPQQLLGELASPADDIYSVGATLYELLTGRPPFYSGDVGYQVREIVPEGINERRRKLGLPCTHAIPGAWEETIAACLAKRPAARPVSAEDIVQRLGLAWAPLAETATSAGQLGGVTIVGPVVKIPLDRSSALVQSGLGKWAELWRWAGVARWHVLLVCAALMALVALTWAMSELRAPVTVIIPPAASQKQAPMAQASTSAVAADLVAQGSPNVRTPSASVAAAGNLANEPAVSTSAAQTPEPTPAPPMPSEVTLETKPAGIPFQVFASAYETPSAEVLRSGETPTVVSLPLGTYRVVYSPSGLTSRAATIVVSSSASAKFYQEFPHGTVKIRTEPDGAEVFCDDVDWGAGPKEVDLLPGRHEITAEHNGRTSRVHHIELADAAEQSVTIDFRTGSSATTHPHRKKPKVDDSMLAKIGRSIKGFFGGDSSKKH